MPPSHDLPATDPASAPSDTIRRLEAVIRERRSADADSSYVARLTRQGRARIAQKLGEEAVEAVIAAIRDDAEALVGEGADLVFHLLVLLADTGLSWDRIMAELDRREGLSGLAEKAARKET